MQTIIELTSGRIASAAYFRTSGTYKRWLMCVELGLKSTVQTYGVVQMSEMNMGKMKCQKAREGIHLP